MIRNFFLLLITLVMLSSCGLQQGFHQRRYLPGRYSEKKDDQRNTVSVSPSKNENTQQAVSAPAPVENSGQPAGNSKYNKPEKQAGQAKKTAYCDPASTHKKNTAVPVIHDRPGKKSFLPFAGFRSKYKNIRNNKRVDDLFGDTDWISLILVFLVVLVVWLYSNGYFLAAKTLTILGIILIAVLVVLAVLALILLIQNTIDGCMSGCM